MVHIQIGGERESKGSPRLCQQENLWCHSEAGFMAEESGVRFPPNNGHRFSPA